MAKIRLIKNKNESGPDTAFSGGFTLKRVGRKVSLTGNGISKEWKMADSASAKAKYNGVWQMLTRFSYNLTSFKELLHDLGIEA